MAGSSVGAGTGPAASGGSGGIVEPCGSSSVCAPPSPPGWLGPIALWEDAPGTLGVPPTCPTGYGPPSDLYAQLAAADANCSCTCKASGQGCVTATQVSVYGDLGCSTECIGASPLACAPVSGCTGSSGTMRAATPSPTGGSCAATITPKAPPVAQWKLDARVCALNAPEKASCAGTGEICVPTPTAPYSSHLCVYQLMLDGQPAPACPSAYPNASDALYSTFADTRGCAACTCSGPTGGSCTGTITLSGGNDCGSGFQYALGSGCQSFSLSAPPSHIQANYTVMAGSCAVATNTHPTGGAKPSGSFRAVCCF